MSPVMWNLNVNLSMKQKQTHRHRETMWLARGREGGGEMDWEFRRCKPLYIEWINNKVLLYNTGTIINIL